MNANEQASHDVEPGAIEETSGEKKRFEEPKLTYVKPKLNKQGKVSQVTQSFFGSFSP